MPAAGTPVPDSPSEQPPVIRRAEVVAFALVSLLVIAVVAVLYLAKAFFLPVVMAFVVGTMLSPAASFLERYRIPRAVGAVLIVTAVGAAVVFMIGLISSPADRMEHATAGIGRAAEGQAACVRPAARALAGAAEHDRRPRHAVRLPDAEIRLDAADRRIPVADLHRIPAVLRDADPVHRELARFAPRVDHDLRRSRCAAADAAHPQRDRGASRQLSAHGDDDQHRRRHRHRHRLRRRAYAQSGGPWRAGRDVELHPDHRPGRDVRGARRRRHHRAADAERRAGRAARLCRDRLPGRAFHHADHHRPQAGAQRAGGLHRARVLDLAVGADGRLPVVAAPDRRR